MKSRKGHTRESKEQQQQQSSSLSRRLQVLVVVVCCFVVVQCVATAAAESSGVSVHDRAQQVAQEEREWRLQNGLSVQDDDQDDDDDDDDYSDIDEQEQTTATPPPRRRAIFFSESKLRSVVEETNIELRDLKRDFLKQMTDVYLAIKLHPLIGYEQARDLKTHAASANVLIGQEFAEIVVKKHITQRRLLAGLKLAFIKFLPMNTLVNLYRRYKSFEWLKDQEQVDLRPKFAGATEDQFVVLYTLIELRARIRAADDVFALTSDNIRRILQVAHEYLVMSNHGTEISGDELAALASNIKQVLDYFVNDIVQWRTKLHETYRSFLKSARPLFALVGGRKQLVKFIDNLINVEALDIELSAEARSLKHPPTITAQIITDTQRQWIPWYVLKSIEEDRKLVLANRKRVLHLVHADPAKRDQDLGEWADNTLQYICRNTVHTYGK